MPPRAIAPQTPQWLQEVILHCPLEVDGEARYASAAQVAFDLANPAQVAISERGERGRRAGPVRLARRWLEARKFEPRPCPPPTTAVTPARIVMVAIASTQKEDAPPEPLRDAVRRICALDERCRVAVHYGRAARGNAERRHAHRAPHQAPGQPAALKPLELAEERLTYHVLESEKPASALIDYATMNDVDQIVIGADARGSPRWWPRRPAASPWCAPGPS